MTETRDSVPPVSVSHTHLSLPTFCDPLYNMDTDFIPRVTYLCFVTPRATWRHVHRALTLLLTHTGGQTHFLDPSAPRNTFTGTSRTLPRHPTLTQGPHMQATSPPLGSPGHSLHPALSTWPSCPLPLCPVSKLVSTHLLATCSAQGRGKRGLALLFAKAAALWPFAHAGRECRKMPFSKRR